MSALAFGQIEAEARGDPVWESVTEGVHGLLENEVEQARSADIGGGERAYCAARAAAIRDLAGSLEVFRESLRIPPAAWEWALIL